MNSIFLGRHRWSTSLLTSYHVPRDVFNFWSNDGPKSPCDLAASYLHYSSNCWHVGYELLYRLLISFSYSDAFVPALRLCFHRNKPFLAKSNVSVLFWSRLCCCLMRKKYLILAIMWFIFCTAGFLGIPLLVILQIHVWPLQLDHKCVFNNYF